MAESITCPECGMTSYHPKDIEEGYCGNCHDWTTPKSRNPEGRGEMSVRILPIVVITKDPTDHPGKYVTRRQWACTGNAVEIEAEPLVVADTLEEARRVVPADLDTRLDRSPDDDPVILEVWL